SITAHLAHLGAHLAVRTSHDPHEARTGGTAMGAASARCALATVTTRPEDWSRGWKGLVVAAPIHLYLRPRASSAQHHGSLAEGLRRVREPRQWQGFLPRSLGLVRGAGRARHLQHRARRGVALPWGSAAANEGRLWKVRLGRQRGALRGLSPARPVGDSLGP